MTEWISSIVLALVASTIWLRGYRPAPLKIFSVFAGLSLAHPLVFTLLYYSPGSQKYIQLAINMILPPMFLTCIYFGFFRWTYMLLGTAFCSLLALLVHRFAAPVFFPDPGFEVSLCIVEGMFAIFLTVILSLRVRRLLQDYRLWLCLCFALYYIFAVVAFLWESRAGLYTENLWYAHQIAIVLAVGAACIGIFIWHTPAARNLIISPEEQFLIPRWLQNRIRFLHLPYSIPAVLR